MGRPDTHDRAPEAEKAAATVESHRKSCVTPLLFVMGKGGVGRTTLSAALAAEFAARGERTLVVQWSLGDALAPLFAAEEGPIGEREVVPGVSTLRFSTEESLRAYFVDHLRLRWFHSVVIRNRHVQRFIRAAPGLDELMFLGHIYSLLTWAPRERGWAYDRVIVDAPALGHGVSLFGVPRAAASLGVAGLLADETREVQKLLDDPMRTAALVVTTPEELAVEETLELWPRLVGELVRPPIAAVINHSVAALGLHEECAWLKDPALIALHQSLVRRSAREALLRERLRVPLFRVDEALVDGRSPLEHAQKGVREWLACLG